MADEHLDDHLRDEVADLVLGDVEGGRRAAMVAHVLACAACRRRYDEVAATVEDLLPAVPGVQPPIGFDERVLARLAADPSGRSSPSRPRSWRWVAVAAALLVAVLVPVGVWSVARDDTGSTAGALTTLYRSRDDAPVGTVSVSEVDGDTVMVVALTGAPDDVAYFCRARLADGRTVDSEPWGAGNGAWVVDLPAGAEVTSVDVLRAGTDRVWGRAELT